MTEVTTQLVETSVDPLIVAVGCNQDEQNALQRVVSLPLVLSTVETLQTYYSNIKSAYPYVIPYLEAAEGLTNAAANLAVASSKPVVGKYGDALNSYVNSGLDKLENKMPILHQPANQVLANTKDRATNLLNDNLDKALCYTENMVDYYLPGVEDFSLSSGENEELIDEKSSERKKRMNGISIKVRRRSYEKAMRRWSAVSSKSRETLNKLNYTVNLIQYAQESLNATTSTLTTSYSNVQETMHKKVITARAGLSNVAIVFSKKWEEKVMGNAERLSKQLLEACSSCLTFLQSSTKFQNLVDKAVTAKEMSIDLCKTFTGKEAISQLSTSIVTAALDKITIVNDLLLDITDKLADYPPLNWLSPDFDVDLLGGMAMEEMEELMLGVPNYHANHITTGILPITFRQTYRFRACTRTYHQSRC